MTLLLRGHSDHYRPIIMRPCCDFSQLIDTHATEKGRKTQLLWIAVGLLSSLFVAELLTGLSSHSLSLLADAGHLLSDVVAIGISLAATRLAQRPAAEQATFLQLTHRDSTEIRELHPLLSGNLITRLNRMHG